MDVRLDTMRLNFHKIRDKRGEIYCIFESLGGRIDKLKDIYKEFITSNTKSAFILGLDSFNFQNKLMDHELSELERRYDLIMNRIYCEYYKLNGMILNYCNTYMTDDVKLLELIKSKTEYPIYKNLEIYKRYDFSLIIEIHDDIISKISTMLNYLNMKQELLSKYQAKSNIGLNINNFVSAYEHEVYAIERQIKLFCEYDEFFHKLHLKYLNRFLQKLKMFVAQVSDDIKFDKVNPRQSMNETNEFFEKDSLSGSPIEEPDEHLYTLIPEEVNIIAMRDLDESISNLSTDGISSTSVAVLDEDLDAKGEDIDAKEKDLDAK